MMKEVPTDIVEHTCPSCPLFSTKPGNVPSHLAFALNEVARLENRKAIGVKLGVLSPFHEAILVGAMQGRNRSDENLNKKDSSNDTTPSLPKIPDGMGQLD